MVTKPLGYIIAIKSCSNCQKLLLNNEYKCIEWRNIHIKVWVLSGQSLHYDWQTTCNENAMIHLYGPINIYKCAVLYMRVGRMQVAEFFIAWTFIMVMHAFIHFPCEVMALRTEHSALNITVKQLFIKNHFSNEFHWCWQQEMVFPCNVLSRNIVFTLVHSK